jgi:hypothetical protein
VPLQDGHPVVATPWPGNSKGISELTIPTMCKFIVRGGDHPKVRRVMSHILKDAGFPKTAFEKASVIRQHVRGAIGYIEDQELREFVQAPWVTLCQDGDDKSCSPTGDCDCIASAVGALLRAAGLKVRVLHIKYYGGAQDHISIAVETERGWLEADATIDSDLKPITKAAKVTMIDPFDPKYVPAGEGAGLFIGVGRHAEPRWDYVPSMERVGAGLVTPGDILAYRAAWNEYVLDTVRAGLECGAAYQGVAAEKQATDPTTAATLAGIGTATTNAANSLLSQWNVFANTSDSTIVLQGATILQSFQATVLAAGANRASMTTGTLKCQLNYVNDQGVVVDCVPGVDPSVQAQIIARIEGLGILASGILQILVTAAGDALVTVGSASTWLAEHGKNLVAFTLSPWVWGGIVVSVVGLGALLIYNADKVGKAVASVSPLHAGEKKRKKRRNRARLAA